tara:strand:- start:320 stop:496 length:177 start_codon:yes stop_codon:yes gene_type:complete
MAVDDDRRFASSRATLVFGYVNWAIHQTNLVDGMTKPRKSCELRVVQDAWTFPEGGSC